MHDILFAFLKKKVVSGIVIPGNFDKAMGIRQEYRAGQEFRVQACLRTTVREGMW
jgi:hypothetical protein